MAKISVKHYTNTMASAPQLDNEWGELTGLLDAVLVNGFGFKTIDSITRVGNIATATVSTGHPYGIGQVLAIAGCDQAAYNGEFRVVAISANTFDFEVQGAPASPATTASAISAKVAPLGFEIVFSATNKRAYRSTHPESAKPLLVVYDGLKTPGYTTSWAKWANVGIAESMSDIDTITGAQAPFDPLAPKKNWQQTQANQWGWFKWYWARPNPTNYIDTANSQSGVKNWVLVGDDRYFQIWINPYGNHQGATGYRHPYQFGEPTSFKAEDAYCCVLVADDHLQSNSVNGAAGNGAPGMDAGGGLATNGNSIGHTVLKNYSGLVPAVGWSAWHIAGISGRTATLPLPNGPDYAIWMQPIYMREDGGHARALMPGVACLPHEFPLPDMSIVNNVQGQSGKKWMVIVQSAPAGSSFYSGQVAVDITGPWR